MREDFMFIYFVENSDLEPWGDPFREKEKKKTKTTKTTTY